MLRGLLIRAIARSAMHFEGASLNLYKKMMEKTKTPRMKELLKTLAEEEEKHISHLEELLQGAPAQERDRWAEKETGRAAAEVFAGKELEHEIEACDFLKRIIDFEETTEAFYRLAGSRTPIPAARKAFELLAEDERRHAQVLHAEFDSLGCKP